MSDLEWTESGTPKSRHYDDVYYSDRDGLAESRFTFLGGCGLPEAWAGKRLFVIGETGFGTGLNFLAMVAAWRSTRQPGQRLHYVSVEAHPLGANDLERAHVRFPEIAAESRALRERYPARLPREGFRRLHLDADRVTLDLLIGEAGEALGELEARVDAWFLDGFAPARNPAMWRDEVLGELARLSCRGARLATFTAAGAVRRGLLAAGFQVEKSAGFGSKRERLVGRFRGTVTTRLPAWAAASPIRSSATPEPSWWRRPRSCSSSRR